MLYLTRWHWDRELNPLMHLVMATESIAPQSPLPLPFPFPFPSGSIYTQRKRKISGTGGDEDILPDDILSDDILSDDILPGDFSVSTSGLDLSETKRSRKQRNPEIVIKMNEFAVSPKSSCTLNLDWERMEFSGDREINSTHSDGKEKVPIALQVEGAVAVETIAGVEGVTRITSKQIGEGVVEGAVVDGRDLIAVGGRVKETLSVDDLRQKLAEKDDRRKAAQPVLNQIRSGHGHRHGVSKADLYSAVSGCFQELSRRHSRGTGSSHALPLKAKSASSAAQLLPSQPRPPHAPLSHPLAAPLPMSIFAPLVRCVPLSRGSNQLSSSSSLYQAPISIPLPLCVLPSSTSIPPARFEPLHSSSSSLFSPSHDAIIESTHYCDDDEVVHFPVGDAYSDKEMKGKPHTCKIMSPAGMGKENKCPQSLGGKSTKHLKKSKASLSDSKRRILGAIRMAELGSTDSCTDVSSVPNIDVTRSAVAVPQECSAQSSELAFEELEQWYLKWKFVLHPTD
jgi:hypothetical protein